VAKYVAAGGGAGEDAARSNPLVSQGDLHCVHSRLPKLGALTGVLAACVCAAALWPTGAHAWQRVPGWDWIDVANEGQVFNSGSAMYVRYGAGNAFIVRAIEGGSVQCTNGFFGDPAPGVVKSCAVLGRWDPIASEGQHFVASAVVRYGASDPDRFTYRSVTGDGWCTNDFFGVDPAYGVVKSCQIAVNAPHDIEMQARGAFNPSGKW
jgi:hypothetical protein